jgi:hypothetical protein
MTSAAVVCVRVDWDRTAVRIPQRTFYTLRVDPEPGHPFGRKGLQLAGAWAQLTAELPEASGMVVLDGDVALDPADMTAMFEAAAGEPEAVHTALARLWPVSTKRADWVWGHWADVPSQADQDNPQWFSLCLTYLPRALIEQCMRAGMKRWAYPGVDHRIAQQAQRMGLTVRVVRDARPCHLNY